MSNKEVNQFDIDAVVEKFYISLFQREEGQLFALEKEQSEALQEAQEEANKEISELEEKLQELKDAEKSAENKGLIKKQKSKIKAARRSAKARDRLIKAEFKPRLKKIRQILKVARGRADILKKARYNEFKAWQKAGFEDIENRPSEIEKLRFDSYKPELVENDVVLSVRHLKQYFESGFGANKLRTKAVHDISFDIHNGEVFGLVGESGCGKTTTGRSIIRLYDITSGSIYFKGHRISGGTRWNEKEIKWKRIRLRQEIKELKAKMKEELDDAEAIDEDVTEARSEQIKDHYNKKIAAIEYEIDEIVRVQKTKIKLIRYDNKNYDEEFMSQIQMIFQDPTDSLDPRMTVEDAIQEGLQIQGYRNKAANSNKVSDVLDQVGLLPEYASRYPHEFSGGQRQRIGIARAIVMQPEFMICDEPVSALDVSIQAQVINLLSDLRDEMGLTLLFVAHDLSLVKYFCDRIAVMYFGRIVELATSEDLFANPLHPYTKSLISAIPKPDPISEKARKRIHYNPAEAHNYAEEGNPTLTEITPGHFVLANEVELERYRKEIEDRTKSKK
ncbi:MAG: ATP-binding cassette domain-containing protein [Erysipelotrichaceae bacterium]|nr:ATP-binding cassette domain-containing protein [Erysipelotrichaceae bacterium]